MSIKVSRILHAGYVFSVANTQIAFDPIFENPFSVNCYAFPEVRFDVEAVRQLKFAAVFISHHHDDHLSLQSLALLERSTPIYLYCVHEELFSLIRELGFSSVTRLELWQPVEIGDFTVTPFQALDEDVDAIFTIEAEGVRILNVVDAWIHPLSLPRLKALAPWDMVLWPFQTLRELEVLSPGRGLSAPEIPAEWMEQLQMLQPRFVVPSSCQFRHEEWSWYNRAMFPISYKMFAEEVTAKVKGAQVVRLNPSVSVEVSASHLKESEPLSWIHVVGKPNEEFDFDPKVEIPSTAEIAKRLGSLSAAESAQVFEYCRSELPQRIRDLGPCRDVYFNKDRLWYLSLYDQHGSAHDFYFWIRSDGVVENCEAHEGRIDWRTEVPLAKLYAALFEGESLTSMYMRINDSISLREADVLEDPLIRALFTGVIGVYQSAQLRKLLHGSCISGLQSPSPPGS